MYYFYASQQSILLFYMGYVMFLTSLIIVLSISVASCYITCYSHYVHANKSIIWSLSIFSCYPLESSDIAMIKEILKEKF